MPFVPSPLERLLFLRLGVGPAVTFDLMGSIGLKVLLTARRIGVVDALAARASTLEELAGKVDADPDRLEVLLDALVAWRYARVRRGAYSLTRTTAKWLASDAPSGYAAFVEWWDELVLPYWDAEMVDIISGDVSGRLYNRLNTIPDGWRRAQAGFEATARLVLPAFVRHIDLPDGPARLLDAGGGHGLYSIALCRKHPQLKADVLDTPAALERAADNIAAAELGDRIHLVPADLTGDDLGTGYDAVLLANVVHGFNPRDNIDVLARIFPALRPGGSVIVLDQFGRIPGRLGGAVRAMLRLAYLGIGDGDMYEPSDVVAWLERSGFRDVRFRRLMRAPGNGVVTGTRPP